MKEVSGCSKSWEDVEILRKQEEGYLLDPYKVFHYNVIEEYRKKLIKTLSSYDYREIMLENANLYNFWDRVDAAESLRRSRAYLNQIKKQH